MMGLRNWDSEVADPLSLTHRVREMLICEWGAFTCLTASPKTKRLLRSLTEAWSRRDLRSSRCSKPWLGN